MWNFLEQAGAARQIACEIRRHVPEYDPMDMVTVMKQAERFEARAAELEYRWLTLPARPPQGRTGSAHRLRSLFHRGS
jgi:hypothetical protein